MSCCNYAKLEDCPNCGAKEGARMGSSSWGHNLSCCGDECGKAVAKKIETNVSKRKYKKKLQKYYDLKEELRALRYEGINGTDPFFEL